MPRPLTIHILACLNLSLRRRSLEEGVWFCYSIGILVRFSIQLVFWFRGFWFWFSNQLVSGFSKIDGFWFSNQLVSEFSKIDGFWFSNQLVGGFYDSIRGGAVV